jgi:signal transduction histidine kinase
MDSLKGTLRARAAADIHGFRFGPAGPPFGNYHRDGSGVCIAAAQISSDGPSLLFQSDSCNANAQALPDPAAAQQALQDAVQGRLDSLWSTQQVDASGPYLIYTRMPIDGFGNVEAVEQYYISEQQYLNELHLLLQVLIGVSALGVAASAGISYLLTRRALQPVKVAMQRQRDFVADAAHELRTPLAIMRTAAELGLSDGEAMDQSVALEQTLAQNAHLTQLVDSLLLLARADSGTITLERQPVDFGRLVRETAAGIAVLAEERDVRLDVTAADLRVLGDAGRLRQVLLILLDNALKHTPDGGTIAVRVERAGKCAQLSVQDSGSGIDPQDLPHIFDRFYRADRARATEGVGLGLSIGRWIVEAHGGRIAAANTPGSGALFTVTLPLAS